MHYCLIQYLIFCIENGAMHKVYSFFFYLRQKADMATPKHLASFPLCREEIHSRESNRQFLRLCNG
jgi:hypothetical protein